MSERERDDKKMLNELLPDPKQAEEDLARGGPRDRTRAHLKRIVAAGLAMAAVGGGAAARADTTTPPGGKPPADNKKGGQDTKNSKNNNNASDPKKNAGGDKNKNGGNNNNRRDGNRPPPDPGYRVVDPVPEPFVMQREEQGWLRLDSTPPGATILIDGKAIPDKTPVQRKLPAGVHAVTLASPDGAVERNFTVDVRANEVTNEKRDLTPPKPPPAGAKEPGAK
jgi:PEGA domain